MKPFSPPKTRPVDRWILTGEIRLKSALMIRTGEPESREIGALPNDRAALGASKNGDDANVYAVELDVDQRPYLPGTALKALARRTLAQLAPDQEEIIETVLFGGVAARRGAGEDGRANTAIGGRAEFRNAYLIGENTKHLAVRGMTKIDAGTRAADDGMLRHQYVVEPGASFRIEILLDGVTEAEVMLLLAGVRQWRDSEDFALGGGTRQGFGRIAWIEERARLLQWNAAAIKKWLDGGLTKDWRAFGEERHDLLAKVNPVLIRNVDRGFAVEISIGGYFLVSYPTDKGDEESKSTANRRPLTRDQSDDDKLRVPLLPGTSMKGALRAQSERILRTMLGNRRLRKSDPIVQRLADELYGSTHRAGRIVISDFVGSPGTTVAHEMVAIDRFSGGAAPGAKFSVDVFEAPKLTGRIVLDVDGMAPSSSALTGQNGSGATREPLSQAAIGLLALTLRDLRDGDIALGYGTRKGYGDVVGATSNGDDILDVLAIAVFSDTSDVAQRRHLLNDTWRALERELIPNQEDLRA